MLIVIFSEEKRMMSQTLEIAYCEVLGVSGDFFVVAEDPSDSCFSKFFF